MNTKEKYITFKKKSKKFKIEEERSITPLKSAMHRAFLPMVKTLILAGAEIKKIPSVFDDHHEGKEEKLIRMLVGLGVGGYTPTQDSMLIHRCVRLGLLDIVKMFLSRGMSPNLKDRLGKTLLEAACDVGSGFMVARLVTAISIKR